ncbi:MAG: S41 family peptidase [Kangiellaceae bacterium]|jgi:peptidase S41-like protein
MKSFKNYLTIFYLLILVSISGCGSSGGESTTYTDEPTTAWQEDISYLITKLRTVHPNVIHSISNQELNQLTDELFDASLVLTEQEIVLEMVKLVSKIGANRDGHLQMGYFVSTGYKIIPLKFYLFKDGVHVIQASSEYQHLIGAKLVGIEGLPMDSIDALVDSILTQDNEHSKEANRNLVYLVPELLKSLSITQNQSAISYDLVPLGSEISEPVSVTPVATNNYQLNVTTNLPKSELLEFIKNDEAFWMEHYEDDNVVYIKMNKVTDESSSQSLSQLAADVLNITENQFVEKVILDLRQNNGGNNQLVSEIVNFLRSPSINQTDKLIVFTDRQTFSAAGNLAAEIADLTQATFMGVSPGGAGNQYGDAKRYDLPNSKLAFFIPTRYWEFGDQVNAPLLLPMNEEVDMTSTEYFANEDSLLARFID